MKKAPLGLILFLYISLFSGSTQSLPQRSARMDSEWKEEKRGKIVDDAIIVEHESEPSSGSENGGPKKTYSSVQSDGGPKKANCVCG